VNQMAKSIYSEGGVDVRYYIVRALKARPGKTYYIHIAAIAGFVSPKALANRP
jgi:hypothetical protein